MQQISVGPVPRYGWPELAGVRVAVTSRAGGVSQGDFSSLNLGFHVGDRYDAVLSNRLRAAAAFGVDLDDMVFCQQVHDRAVAVVGEADRGRGARSAEGAVPASDAAVTTSPQVALAVLVADCVPVLLHDPVRRVLAVAHAGWRGIARGVVPAAIDAMSQAGPAPTDMVAAIGPCAPADRYRIGADVAEELRGSLSDPAAVLPPDGTGGYLFDLAGAVQQQLTAASVTTVHTSQHTTGPGTPFYSHRFEGPTGRFAMIAQLAP